jgi:hypothetical protein
MKIITTRWLVAVAGFAAFTSTESYADKRVPYQTNGQLEKKCKAAGGTFDSSKFDHFCQNKGNTVYCSKGNKKCISWSASGGSKAANKPLPEILGQAPKKKRPRVLQESGNSSGSEPGNVKPTVLGGNPRATPSGNSPNITSDGSIQ